VPEVSILIPAYRPDFFDVCIASALAQTHADFEIVISDDCPTDAIERLLAKWDDPRIRYERNPTPRCYASNRDNLLRLAGGRYLKFLFDDDLLYPRSVQLLVDAMQATGAGAAFHHRHVVDAFGRLVDAPAVIEAGSVSAIPPETVYSKMIGRCVNWVGEPSNTLIDAEALRSIDGAFEIEGRPSRFLADVTMIYNFSRRGLGVVGVGEFGSAFRQHGAQTSSESSAGFAAGVFEWELLARSARAIGGLSQEQFRQALITVHTMYERHLARHPVFASFLSLDPALALAAPLDPGYLRALDLAYLDLDLRRLGPVVQAATGGAKH